jgi:hypothetical protein
MIVNGLNVEFEVYAGEDKNESYGIRAGKSNFNALLRDSLF